MVATTDGIHAVEVITEHEPDVVLLDIRMPGKDGLAVLAAVQQLPSPPAVAMLTTFDADEYVAASLRSGRPGSCSRTPIQVRYQTWCVRWPREVWCCRAHPKVISGYLDDHVDSASVAAVKTSTSARPLSCGCWRRGCPTVKSRPLCIQV